ncbi:uncharacterized protein C1orf158-like [Oncorhynchus tshawytscha]|uniref:uncharacterized protein C1orf158-like n=1 Tax=Oncorhynchus tshawytscha TaxID=74940 RepID=UPI001C3C5F11|nr:uncharacterized protein C1orf158-like [Oncorhynchus tshawytscha]
MHARKWTQPGWRMAQRYANKVLIGNWVEEKLQYTRECKTATTAPTVQTTSHRGPDVIVRQMALWKAEGLAAKMLLSHHGTLPSHYLVTLYDEMYRRQGSSTLLTLCTWHPDRLARMPEKSDHHRYPILSVLSSLSFPSFSFPPPTNFGLVESRQVCLDQHQPPFSTLSVYRTAYQRHPLSAFCQPRLASVAT